MLRLLECALALDEHRNFGRAAKQLGISQPTLTRSIQVLERQLDAQLFDRSGERGVEPTSFGAIVLKSARRVTLDISELKREVLPLRSEHEAVDRKVSLPGANSSDNLTRFGLPPAPAASKT